MTAPSDQPQSATDDTTPVDEAPAAPVEETPAAPVEETAPSTAEAPVEETAPSTAEAPVEETAPTTAEAPVEETTPSTAEAAETPADAGESTAVEEATPSAAPTAEQPAAEAATDAPTEAATDAPTEAATDAPADAPKKGKKKRGKKGGGDAKASDRSGDKQAAEKKASGPDPQAIIKRIGTTSEAALAYVQSPDPKLSRMSRKHREAVITDIPPVTAGALLGPDALCRHFLASAASGRYQDLFFLWDLFKLFPEECKPVLAQRQRAQEKARAKLRTATHLGLLGDATRVAGDIDRASGLPWRWLKETLDPMGPAIVQRPAVLAALMRRDPSYAAELPTEPSDRWLAEAAGLRESGADVPEGIDSLLGANADRLPATVATLSMAQSQYPDRVPALIDRVDLEARDIGATMAWARDHGHEDQLKGRIAETVSAAASRDRAEGLATWRRWRDLGVELPMPESLTTPNLDGLDLGRPESAELIKVMIDGGADLDPQAILDQVAADNRMLGEKAFEAFVCAGFDAVHLPLALEGNPMVRPETRCPSCQAWTWVRPGLEKRCPRGGCPLRSQEVVATPEDAAAAVDAAVASIDAGVTTTPAPAAAPAPAQPRPAALPDPAPAQPAAASETGTDAPTDAGTDAPTDAETETGTDAPSS